jgi:hypothetical protein
MNVKICANTNQKVFNTMKEQIELDFTEAKIQRDKGIEQALTNADNSTPGWSSIAYEEFKRFLLNNPGEFMAEEFRSHCAVIDFPFPPSNRAFGGVILKASFDGLIKFVRYGRVSNPRAHACFASVWKRA